MLSPGALGVGAFVMVQEEPHTRPKKGLLEMSEVEATRDLDIAR
jgi:hypothetical protein